MSTTSAPRRRAPSGGGRRRAAASVVPVVVGSAAVVVSLALAIVAASVASTPIDLIIPGLPLIDASGFGLSLAGYLLTPIVVVVSYGWDAQSQRIGLRENTDFILRPAYRTILLWLSAVSIVLGLWHILNMSVPLSEWWAPA